MPHFNIQIIDQLSNIDCTAWNALLPDSNPFLRHEFLSGLETHGCITGNTGWLAKHFLAFDEKGKLAGALPMYLKSNSFGEFVFDWSWVSAYEDAGLAYYPKLISAIPYTPVTGPRLLIAKNQNREVISETLLQNIKEHIDSQQLSSFHCLFPPTSELTHFSEQHLLKRLAFQYHWENNSYESFEHYLSFFRSRKRQNVKRERRLIKESNITLHVLHGNEMDEQQWQTAYRFYQSTFLRKGNYPALTLNFFKSLANTMPNSIVVVLAEHKGQYIAAAINLRSDERLYGRYWGCEVPFQNLHFEVCFYTGIDYCIKNSLKFFEPGAQGEHKITRGFLPTETYSMHWIADPRFRAAISGFLQREQQALSHYRPQLDKLSPFRESE